MKFFYDTEFIEDGRTIDLISIGIVAEDGRELYRVVRDEEIITRAVNHPWLGANVVPHLPVERQDENDNAWGWDWNVAHGDWWNVVTRVQVATCVRDFLLAEASGVELWAWYGAYDHVVLAQLFGTMMDLPSGVPMWTNDLQQEIARRGISEEQLPQQADGQHNALADARHLKALYDHVTFEVQG